MLGNIPMNVASCAGTSRTMETSTSAANKVGHEGSLVNVASNAWDVTGTLLNIKSQSVSYKQ